MRTGKTESKAKNMHGYFSAKNMRNLLSTYPADEFRRTFTCSCENNDGVVKKD
jgi:hypothetical protein